MPRYKYLNGNGETIEIDFERGKAPDKICGYNKVIDISGLSIRFRGDGWTKSGIGLGYNEKNFVRWRDVEKAIKNTQWDSEIKPQYDYKKLK